MEAVWIGSILRYIMKGSGSRGLGMGRERFFMKMEWFMKELM